MATYVVMEPPAVRGRDVAEEACFVRDGFTFFAFLVPFVWFLWHRMWVEAVAAIVLMLVLGFLTAFEPFVDTGTLVSLAVSVLIGLEANALRVAALERRGWRQWGVVEAANRDEAEMRYVAEAVEEAGPSAASVPATTPALPAVAPSTPTTRTGPRRPSGPAVGLFDYPGR